MNKSLAVVVGFIGKFPVAGMSLYNLHYIIGLQELGYEIHYVERQNYPNECYDPNIDDITDNPSFALDYLSRLLPQYRIPKERYSFIDRENRCHGSGWARLNSALDRADFVLTLADETWFDDLERCPYRAFIDGDPMFTQVELLDNESVMAKALKHYDVLFTYGVRMGKPDCHVPEAGRTWIPSRPVVATRLWEAQSSNHQYPLTTVMLWSGKNITHDGRTYGHKDLSFKPFLDLPKHTQHPIHLALGGQAPREKLLDHGWHLVNPLRKTGTISDYMKFITKSYADLGIAKQAYAASRSGWFSDRSTCYLAAGRPVLHQDTGCGDLIPVGKGILLFSDIDDILEAIECLNRDYEFHSQKAREIAEEHFEASKIIGLMLNEAGFR